jgi:O-antigen/teichoic acid export membrane protein
MNNTSGYIWNFLSRFGGQFIFLVANIVLARMLDPEDFGMVGVLSIIFLVANTLAESGLGGALIIEKEIRKEDCATIFIFNLCVSLTLYFFIFLFANKIESFYHIEGLGLIARCLGIVFVINALGVVPRTILAFQLRFKELCLLNIISSFLGAFVAIILAYSHFEVFSLVYYQIITAVIMTIGSIIVTRYSFPLNGSFESFKRLFSFGFYTTASGVVNTIYENLLTAIYGKFVNVGIAGFFSQAKKIEEASSQAFLAAVNNTTFPVLAKYK